MIFSSPRISFLISFHSSSVFSNYGSYLNKFIYSSPFISSSKAILCVILSYSSTKSNSGIIPLFFKKFFKKRNFHTKSN